MPPARPTKPRTLEPALAFLQELWALDHALGSTSKRMLDRMGITAEQRMVLRFVGKFPEMTAGELAALLHVEKSTLSLALKRLEEKRLVERRRDELDARKTRLLLTAEGRKFDRPTIGTVERAVRRALLATRPADVELIRSFLRHLVKMLVQGEAERSRRHRRLHGDASTRRGRM